MGFFLHENERITCGQGGVLLTIESTSWRFKAKMNALGRFGHLYRVEMKIVIGRCPVLLTNLCNENTT